MTQEKIRLTIGKFCYPHIKMWHDDVEGKFTTIDKSSTVDDIGELLDYPNDLNATYEMEKYIPQEKIYQYIHYLCAVIHPTCETNNFDYIHATPSQKCEAFLKILNLWEN